MNETSQSILSTNANDCMFLNISFLDMKQLNKFFNCLDRRYYLQSFLYLKNWHPTIRGLSSCVRNNRPLGLAIFSATLESRPVSKCKTLCHPGSSSYVRHITSNSHNVNEKLSGSTKVLYDGECKICELEISLLKRYVGTTTSVKFIDISKADYDPQKHGGVSYEDAMKEMHVVGSDGKVYSQGDAVRHMYRVSGFSWLAAATELPVVKPVCDYLYIKFAEYRLRKAFDRCDDGSCNIKLKHLRDKLNKSEK